MLLSICCGAVEHEFIKGFCSMCNEGTEFEEEETLFNEDKKEY